MYRVSSVFFFVFLWSAWHWSISFKVSGQDLPKRNNVFSGNFYLCSLEPVHTKSQWHKLIAEELTKCFTLSSSERQNPRNYFQTTKFKNVHSREMYFHYPTVVNKKGKVAFHKETKHYTTCLPVLYLVVATKTRDPNFWHSPYYRFYCILFHWH